MRRYVATISMYIYVDDQSDAIGKKADGLAIKNAKKICKKLNKKYDCNADIIEIGEQPYASTEYREI